jgi:hypothetical protein
MEKIFKFGEDVEGYHIPVLNEREVRAAAGILFVMMGVSISLALMKHDFLLIKYATIIFLTDISIRVFINPRFSPTLILGRLIVRNQVPEYVGAAQKKFAWVIGFILASTIFIHLVVINAFSPISGIICLICLIFLFFETSFGICLGCIAYVMIYKDKAQYCPGEVCSVNAKQEIQKTSTAQLLVVAAFIAYIALTVTLFHEEIGRKPYDLFGIFPPPQSEVIGSPQGNAH